MTYNKNWIAQLVLRKAFQKIHIIKLYLVEYKIKKKSNNLLKKLR